jgi:hypothetical protein
MPLTAGNLTVPVVTEGIAITKRFFGFSCLTMTPYGPARACPGVSDMTRRRLSNQGKR